MDLTHFINYADTASWDGVGTHPVRGRVACNNGEDEVDLTDCVSSVSCPICQERLREDTRVSDYMEKMWAQLNKESLDVVQRALEVGIDDLAEQAVENLKKRKWVIDAYRDPVIPDLVHVTVEPPPIDRININITIKED